MSDYIDFEPPTEITINQHYDNLIELIEKLSACMSKPRYHQQELLWQGTEQEFNEFASKYMRSAVVDPDIENKYWITPFGVPYVYIYKIDGNVYVYKFALRPPELKQYEFTNKS